MHIERIGIDRSVGHIFPADALVGALADLDVDVAIIPEGSTGDTVDAVVTFEHRDWFIDVDWVHSILAGVDRYPLDELADRGVILTNSTGIHGEAAGQTVAAYMLTFARRLHRYRDYQREARWHQLPGEEMFILEDETICVVGLGTIGQGIAKYARGLGMRVVGVRRRDEPVDDVERLYPPAELHAAIAGARFVALAVPLTDDTAGLIDAATLDRMRDDAYLINVARGPVVDEEALIDALRRDAIAGAALDVYEHEPLASESPLWGFDDVLLTPHVSALFPEYPHRVADIVRANIDHIDAGSQLINRVL